MILPDVNILISALRADSPHHGVAKPWLEAEVQTGRPFAISTLALSAVVRIVTTPRFFPEPSTTAEAFAFAGALLEQPGCITVEPQSRHWGLFSGLVRQTNARSKLVTDAWYAALAIEHGCEWVTLDEDFKKFPGLKLRLLK